MSKHRAGVQSPEGSIADVNDNWEVGSNYEGLEGGSAKGGRGVKNREASLTAHCLICTGAAAAHQHYGAVCCYSCRAFFRRGITRNYSCVRGDNLCQVNSITRTNCKRCRYARCLAVGMKPELVDATLKRKQEEKRRQELIDIQHEMGIQTVGDMQSQTSQAVTGMMQLQQGGVSASQALHLQAQAGMTMQQQQAQHVLQAVQGLQTPLPRHLVQQEMVTEPPVLDRSDESLLYQLSQALEGRKKVLLELRNGDGGQDQQGGLSDDNIALDTIESDQAIPEYVEVEEPPRAHQVNQPLRQQTYYIFHPLTQTFEPITIAEFEENAVIEEVVVAEDYSIAKQDSDENTNPVVNEHDYIELANENGPQIKRPRLSYEEKPNVDTLVAGGQGSYFSQEPVGHYEEVERKPVIAPVIKERKSRSGSTEIKTIKIEKPDVAVATYTSVIKRLTPELIEETVRNHKHKLDQVNKVGGCSVISEAASHVVEEVVETVSTVTDLSRVIEETIGSEGVITEERHQEETNLVKQVPVEKINDDNHVDIEELVDVCFEEELQKSVIEEETIIEEELSIEKKPGSLKEYDSEKEQASAKEELMSEAASVEEIQPHEIPKSNNVKVIQRTRKVTGTKKRRQSGSLLPLKKRRTHFNQTVALNSHKVLYMGFTVEEDFKVTDLTTRREVVQGMFNQLINAGEGGKKKLGKSFDVERKRKLASSLFLGGFEEFEKLDKTVAFRRIFESWPAVVVAEMAASGCLNGLHEQVKLLDNVVFYEVESVGKLLGGDCKVAVLFLMLTLTSQDSLSQQTKEISNLQTELSLLLFRYLNSKMQAGVAAGRVHALIGCLETMHRCGKLYLKKVMV